MITKTLIAVSLIWVIACAALPALESIDFPEANLFNTHSQIANEIAP